MRALHITGPIWTPPLVRKSDLATGVVDCSRISGPSVGAFCPGHDGKSRAGSQSVGRLQGARLVIGLAPRRSDRCAVVLSSLCSSSVVG